MKQEKKKMSIGRQILLSEVVIGLLWIGSGITRAFGGIVMNIIHYVFFFGVLAVIAVLAASKLEEEDEMCSYHHMKAKAKTVDLMHWVYCVAAVLSAVAFGLLQNADIYWGKVIAALFFILMGVQRCITGIVFRSLEAE